ncbi:hypothetical protein ACFL6C_09795 [Myxococcota bacterium]
MSASSCLRDPRFPMVEQMWVGSNQFVSASLMLFIFLSLDASTSRAQPSPRAGSPTLTIQASPPLPFTFEELERALAVRLPGLNLRSAESSKSWDILVDAVGTRVTVDLRSQGVSPSQRVVDVDDARGPAAARLVVLCIIDDLRAIVRGETPVSRRPVTRGSDTSTQSTVQERHHAVSPVATAGLVFLLQDGALLPGFSFGLGLALARLRVSLSTALLLSLQDLQADQLKLRRIPVWMGVGTRFPVSSDFFVEGQCHGGVDILSAGRGGFFTSGESNIVIAQGGLSVGMGYKLWDALSFSAVVGMTILSRRVEYRFDGSSLHHTGWSRGRLLVILDLQP